MLSDSGWQARLTLGFTCDRSGRTLLSRRRHEGPLQVQRPFYPENNGACHIYILHPPGGVAGGDTLTVEAEVEPGAHALITTPAAGKFYRSNGAIARQTQTLRVTAGAALEWLPQESIVFRGARVRSLTRVELSGDAAFLGWEILCLGRPAAGERFDRGYYRQDIEIWRDGYPLFLENGRYEGGSEVLSSAWGLRGMPVTANLIGVTQQPELVEAVRSGVNATEPGELFGVSQLDGALVCRYQGPSAERARRYFSRAWALLRPGLLGKPACAPRIWNT